VLELDVVFGNVPKGEGEDGREDEGEDEGYGLRVRVKDFVSVSG
jgi:hypothetical protein